MLVVIDNTLHHIFFVLKLVTVAFIVGAIFVIPISSCFLAFWWVYNTI